LRWSRRLGRRTEVLLLPPASEVGPKSSFRARTRPFGLGARASALVLRPVGRPDPESRVPSPQGGGASEVLSRRAHAEASLEDLFRRVPAPRPLSRTSPGGVRPKVGPHQLEPLGLSTPKAEARPLSLGDPSRGSSFEGPRILERSSRASTSPCRRPERNSLPRPSVGLSEALPSAGAPGPSSPPELGDPSRGSSFKGPRILERSSRASPSPCRRPERNSLPRPPGGDKLLAPGAGEPFGLPLALSRASPFPRRGRTLPLALSRASPFPSGGGPTPEPTCPERSERSGPSGLSRVSTSVGGPASGQGRPEEPRLIRASELRGPPRAPFWSPRSRVLETSNSAFKAPLEVRRLSSSARSSRSSRELEVRRLSSSARSPRSSWSSRVLLFKASRSRSLIARSSWSSRELEVRRLSSFTRSSRSPWSSSESRELRV